MCDKAKSKQIAPQLLAWYDTNAREMPWRIGPADRRSGIVPDPYRVWMSEIMLQQTTVAAVTSYFIRFTDLWPTVVDLANAKDDDVMGEWAGLGYYARARNLLKCARHVRDRLNGRFPDTYDELIALPGIGPYTAAAVSSIAFDRAETVVDGNVERVVSRLFRVETPLPAAKKLLTELAASLTPTERPGDYAQAIMDLGATVCTPKSPKCDICPLTKYCAGFEAEDQARFPLKTPKKPKPTRRGFVYLAKTSEGNFLLEKRPERGLLGGMLGWPGSDWSETPDPAPPFAANWEPVGEIKHTFTHFHLFLSVCVVEDIAAPGEHLVQIPQAEFDATKLPNVMKKAFDLAQSKLNTPQLLLEPRS